MFFIKLVRQCLVCALLIFTPRCWADEKFMSKEERAELREEARAMFYHGYNAYMENAFPADELMPLSCKGRYRGLTPNRGDIDDCLGNFSLTLIDTLDTLVILGDVAEFESAVKLVISTVSFDNDVVVSVFETNIRILGGLLSAHVLASYLQHRDSVMPWYKGELLDMAKDVGFRLLPAFNTTTGIPHSRVNLMYGIKSDRLESSRETCTACAGSMILEMAALSRLTGETVFEEKAQKAMDELWKMRHRSSDLMGTVLNVHSGDWIRRDSGVGAGIDSYYEYCLKAYILLGDNKYLNRFNRHYSAIMKYISQGPMLLDVHMHRPNTNSRNFMDALLAFWPGLQVLKGDIKPAVETHEMLYQIMQRHKFIPEAFTTDFQVHWGNHPLRPEFLESTYYLYEATNDPYYLEVGKKALKTLQKYARVPCGYAAVNDVRTAKQEDRMDSFVLSETFKYLFMLFADKEDLILNVDEFIFTTEGHLLPLTLGGRLQSNNSYIPLIEDELEESEFSRKCPNTLKLFPESLRKPLQNMVDDMCPKRRLAKRRITAHEFSASNVNHLKMIKDMGISIIALKDERVQLVHSFSAARSAIDAEEGLLFMQEMVELSKLQKAQSETNAQAISFTTKNQDNQPMVKSVQAGPAQFGPNLKNEAKITARTQIVHPFRACVEISHAGALEGKIALIERGDCMFIEKVRKAQTAGAVAAIIIDNTPDSSAATSPMFSMSGDGTDDVTIPAVFLFTQDATELFLALSKDPLLEITLSEFKGAPLEETEEHSMFFKLRTSVQEFLNKHTNLGLSTLLTVGHFKADINFDHVKIYFEQSSAQFDLPKETKSKNPILRKTLMNSVVKKDTYFPLNVVQNYYMGLTGLVSEDIELQTKFILNQLMIEYTENQKKDDALIQLENAKNLALSINLEDLGVQRLENLHNELLDKKKKRLETLTSLLESIDQLEKNMFEKNKVVMNTVLNKLSDSDDIIISEPSDKTIENIENSENSKATSKIITSESTSLPTNKDEL